MTSFFLRAAVAAILLTSLLGAPASVRAATRGACHCRAHVVATTHLTAHARRRVARLQRHVPYVSVPRIPRYDPAQVEAEVHEIARYRTPYPYPALFGPF